MKLDLILKDYSNQARDNFKFLTIGMDYNYQLKLAQQLSSRELEMSEVEASNLYTLIQPLSPQKKIRVLTNKDSTLAIKDSVSLTPSYIASVKKLSRKNKIKSTSDLLDQYLVNKPKDQWESYSYKGPLEFLLKIDGLKFYFENESYTVFFPKTKRDFLEASQQLKTCINTYNDRHLTSTIKFFIKKNDQFYCSVEPSGKRNGHDTYIFYALQNTKPSYKWLRCFKAAFKNHLKPVHKLKQDLELKKYGEKNQKPQSIKYLLSNNQGLRVSENFWHYSDRDTTKIYYQKEFIEGKLTSYTKIQFKQEEDGFWEWNEEDLPLPVFQRFQLVKNNKSKIRKLLDFIL